MRHLTERNLSQLSYISRVIAESGRDDRPLLERMNFLAIAADLTDDFVRTRLTEPAPPKKARRLVQGVKRAVRAAEKQAKQLKPLLRQEKLRMVKPASLDAEQLQRVRALVGQKTGESLQAVVMTEKQLQCLASGTVFLCAYDAKRERWLMLPLPEKLPPLLRLRDEKGSTLYLPSEKLAGWIALLPQDTDEAEEEDAEHPDAAPQTWARELSWTGFRLLREAAPCGAWGEYVEDDLASELAARATAPVALLETTARAEDETVLHVCACLGVTDETRIVHVRQCGRAAMWHAIGALPGMSRLRFPSCQGRLPMDMEEGNDLFAAVAARDRLLIHPYESYQPVLRLMRDAAQDEHVRAIRIMLYRVAEHSAVVDALCEAARQGKRVDVLVELRARFDEQRNLMISALLRKAGCHVYHARSEWRAHGKAMLIERKEDGRIRRYAHLSTGNYHMGVASSYVDVSLLTAREAVCEDTADLFRYLMGETDAPQLETLVASPGSIRAELLRLIRREMAHAYAGRPCGIRARMNALTDRRIISALYDASRAGVPIDLTVRGMCALQPGIPGVSESITVRSVVGRYLEHARVLECRNGGETEWYLSSADWMPRNLKRRTELLFPVLDAACQQKLAHWMDLTQRDTDDAWTLHVDEYTAERCTMPEETFSSQQAMMTGEVMDDTEHGGMANENL